MNQLIMTIKTSSILLMLGIMIWQPPKVNRTMIGNGTDEEPLGVNTDTIATQDWVTSSIAASDTFATYDSVNTLIAESAYSSPYDEYVAFIGQSGTSDPIAVVFETLTTGAITWSRIDAGSYHGTCTGCFPINKRFATATLGTLAGNATNVQIEFNDANTVKIYTTASSLPEEWEGEVYLSIRIYP